MAFIFRHSKNAKGVLKWLKDCGEEMDDSFAEILEDSRKSTAAEMENPFGGEE